jgi:predicted nucleic acid-binding protein
MRMSVGGGIVVDAWTALAFLQSEEPAQTVIRRYLRRAKTGRLRVLINLVNLGEVYYRMLQIAGADAATDKLDRFRTLPIEITAVREPVVMEAARIKAAHPLSYADAFAVATARLEGARLLTGDPEIFMLPPSVARVIRLDRRT